MCDAVLPVGSSFFCRDCQKELRIIREPVCMRCGRPLTDPSADADDLPVPEYCRDCRLRAHRTREGTAPFVYAGDIQASILRMKYGGRAEYAAFYAAAIFRTGARRIRRWDPEVIIPVPVHRRRELDRGYNQAEELAAALSERTGIPYAQPVRRIRRTKPQKGLTPAERQRNVRGAFRVTGETVPWKRILLVDDIYTTGSTLDELASVLIAAGGKEIWFACACVSPGAG